MHLVDFRWPFGQVLGTFEHRGVWLGGMIIQWGPDVWSYNHTAHTCTQQQVITTTAIKSKQLSVVDATCDDKR